MKIIVSHDVDHLYGKDHWFRDLIYPKMWVRSFLEMITRRISIKEAWLRSTSCFKKNRHFIDELMDYDKEHGVESVFFFGMNQGLGMSYRPNEARAVIQRVHENGYAVGVHGIAFDSYEGIKKEHDTFVKLMGFEPCGIRMHYVRFNADTFANEEKAGYVFDTTEFDKPSNGTVKDPYKVGNMWEFPLTIMDGYIPQDLEGAKKATLDRLEECRKKNMQYISVLFHDVQFNDGYTAMRDWYQWLIEMIEESDDDSFISYENAIKELEAEADGR